MVIGDAEVFEELNIGVQAHSSQGTRARNSLTHTAEAHGPLVQIAESSQLGPFVSDISHIEQQVRNQFLLNAEVPLLNVSRTLVRVLPSARPSWPG